MNDTPLHPENVDEFFQTMLTRPSPLPLTGLELGVLEVCHLRTPQGELYPASESYFCSIIWGLIGQFSVYVDGIRYPVRGGELLLLSPGGVIRADADESDNHAYYLLLDGPQAKTVVSQVGLWDGVFPCSRPPNIRL